MKYFIKELHTVVKTVSSQCEEKNACYIVNVCEIIFL